MRHHNKNYYGVIYAIKCFQTNKFYIGQSKCVVKRISRHFSKDEKCPKLFNAIKKYGKENFIWGIVEFCNDVNHLNEMEEFYINKFNSIENGYNVEKGGNVKEFSIETKNKMSKLAKERMSNPEIRKQISDKLRGQKLSEETRRRMSVARKGNVIISEKQKQIISITQKNRVRTIEERERIRLGAMRKFEFKNTKNGETFIVEDGFENFCEKYGLNTIAMRGSLTKKKINKNGWSVRRIKDE